MCLLYANTVQVLQTSSGIKEVEKEDKAYVVGILFFFTIYFHCRYIFWETGVWATARSEMPLNFWKKDVLHTLLYSKKDFEEEGFMFVAQSFSGLA